MHAGRAAGAAQGRRCGRLPEEAGLRPGPVCRGPLAPGRPWPLPPSGVPSGGVGKRSCGLHGLHRWQPVGWRSCIGSGWRRMATGLSPLLAGPRTGPSGHARAGATSPGARPVGQVLKLESPQWAGTYNTHRQCSPSSSSAPAYASQRPSSTSSTTPATSIPASNTWKGGLHARNDSSRCCSYTYRALDVVDRRSVGGGDRPAR